MTTVDGLIGHSGFVGGNLAQQHVFQKFYNSENIESIQQENFDVLVCAGTPGNKRLANKEPEADWLSITRLMNSLKNITARTFILISTIDVYPSTQGANENYLINKDGLTPYGKHRRLLEEFVQNNFNSLIVRLPGIFGPGLKKNAIYDFIQGDQMFINHTSILQFYYLNNLWQDITRAQQHGIKLINFVTEPLAIEEIATKIFHKDYYNKTEPASFYDVHTIHAPLWNQTKPYLYLKDQVLADLVEFVEYFKK